MAIHLPAGTTPGEALPRLVSVKQTLHELGIGRTLFYELLAAGKLLSVTVGRRRFIPREAIEEFVASLMRGRT